MAKKLNTWMPLYVGDYLADTGRLTTEGHGAYLLLLMDYWRNGPPPDDDEVLSGIVRLPVAKWKRLRLVIEPFFTLAEGRWNHKRVDEELVKAAQIIEQRVSAGKASAERRWKQTGNGRCNGRSTGVTTGDVTEPQRGDTPSQSPSPFADADDARDPNPSPGDQVLDALGVRKDPRWFGDGGRVQAWINQGADLNLDILPTIRRVMALREAKQQGPPRSLNYFDQPIADAVATRNRPLPEGTPNAASPESRNGFVTVALDRARGAR